MWSLDYFLALGEFLSVFITFVVLFTTAVAVTLFLAAMVVIGLRVLRDMIQGRLP